MRPGWKPMMVTETRGTLVSPEGVKLDMQVYTRAPKFWNLVEMSWNVDADPLELLKSYLDPQGRPLLTRFVKED